MNWQALMTEEAKHLQRMALISHFESMKATIALRHLNGRSKFSENGFQMEFKLTEEAEKQVAEIDSLINALIK